MPSIDKRFLRGKVTPPCAGGVCWPMRHSTATMQARNDRLETNYRPHPPSAHQQRPRGATFESLSKDAGRHGGVRAGEVFRVFGAEYRCCKVVLGGGAEISPSGLENQGAGSCGPAWWSAGRDHFGIRNSSRGGVCSDSAGSFDAGAGIAIRAEPGSARIIGG